MPSQASPQASFLNSSAVAEQLVAEEDQAAARAAAKKAKKKQRQKAKAAQVAGCSATPLEAEPQLADADSPRDLPSGSADEAAHLSSVSTSPLSPAALPHAREASVAESPVTATGLGSARAADQQRGDTFCTSIFHCPITQVSTTVA